MLENDLQKGVVSLDILKLAREPETALEKVTEKVEVLDSLNKSDPESAWKMAEEYIQYIFTP